MKLNSIPKRKNRVMPGKRIGRGYGSGVGGHTVGRGTKGQKSRAGHKSTRFFEGGNVPFFRRMPKYKGFNQPQKVEAQAVNLEVLDKEFKDGDLVNLESLVSKGIARKNSKVVKILGKGEITKKLKVEGLKISESAIEKIKKAGGSIK
ncbi:50S ribosomal protein L15 [Candidatus Dojkabacteria bacterium]|jgi:large subunit ribosomal protein L15|uniref:Large ribosomal subunit protein uL15 n=1 Tax=Candidatus Dojkabacteria bacterium TaxID=2099670 RepID=A0A847D035_9BACT|nr:50S ribosomal protein L15 [Candidatus Dojkabacteria bacterium]NLD25339.1 50S ribosomal protein L15 [Candidatus Dojkabacteria bacterium]HOZ44487.1 50S ribosomal protein L15 [Candidatus Dojkabacteria bacterium]HPR91687.1 50S ribosomal protein L15 [Candidatus Dojkabacteria bacterium]HRY74321.1 50S ribosomal protein L15 [Candidatus Dojkabacteria bacterium]